MSTIARDLVEYREQAMPGAAFSAWLASFTSFGSVATSSLSSWYRLLTFATATAPIVLLLAASTLALVARLSPAWVRSGMRRLVLRITTEDTAILRQLGNACGVVAAGILALAQMI